MAVFRITDLRLKTIVGVNDRERKTKQDVLINVEVEADVSKAVESDNIDDTFNYRSTTKKIIKLVEESEYQLLEKLADEILKVTTEDEMVKKAVVRVGKPGALRFADSVSVEVSNNE